MDATKLFLDGINTCAEFHEAITIVKSNSKGKVWLIGGSIYRTIANQLYNVQKPSVDFDFIIEKGFAEVPPKKCVELAAINGSYRIWKTLKEN